jgi:hypothetical protein
MLETSASTSARSASTAGWSQSNLAMLHQTEGCSYQETLASNQEKWENILEKLGLSRQSQGSLEHSQGFDHLSRMG